MLSTTSYGGRVQTTPLLIAHGLFGSARNWGTVAKTLSENRPVTAVDMRNHGDSFWADTHSYLDLAADLASSVRGKHDVLGHSMGGKAAMTLALTQPDRVRRLIVADIAPVEYAHSQLDLIEAMQSLDLSQISSRSEADKALAAKVDDPLVRAFLLQSLKVREGRWSLNLEALGNEMANIMSFPDIDATFTGPTLFLAGGRSDYIREDYSASIKRLFPKAMVEVIPNAGHWLHAEEPSQVIDAVNDFLSD